MLPTQRRMAILAEIRERAAVSADDLSRQFAVSLETIRRDLRGLQERAQILTYPQQWLKIGQQRALTACRTLHGPAANRGNLCSRRSAGWRSSRRSARI